MSIAVHLLYMGTGGSARRFAEEMESSGTAADSSDDLSVTTSNIRNY